MEFCIIQEKTCVCVLADNSERKRNRKKEKNVFFGFGRVLMRLPLSLEITKEDLVERE